nr:CASP-like protein 2B1 [Ipomoea batatas]
MIRGSVLFNKPLAWAIFFGDQVTMSSRLKGITLSCSRQRVGCDSEVGSVMISRGLSTPLFLQDLKQN